MANVKTSTFTTANGTRVSITVNGEEFRIEGRRDETFPPQPLDLWTLRRELTGIKMLIVGWSMGIVAVISLSVVVMLAAR